MDSQHPSSLVTVNNYYPTDQLQQVTFGNGLSQYSVVQPRLQVCETSLNSSGATLAACGSSAPTGNVQTFNFSYGTWGSTNNGNVSSFSGTGQQNFARSYSFDSLNRLSTMSASGDYTGCTGLSWSYDNWGNRTAQSVTGGSCPSAFTTTFSTNTNRMDGFAYDAAGDQQKDSSYCYAYDAEGRITTVYQLDCATFVASYVYDGLGRRIETNHGSWQMYFVYNIEGQPVDEWDQGGMGYTGWYRAYAYLGGHMVAQYQNNTTYFAMLDHLGSTHILTNYPTPTVYDSIDYTPFGDIFSGTSNTTHKFTGKERDTETNLDYFGARYFSSVQARFLTPDWDAKPVTVPYAHFGNPQSLNLYAYVGNNPITLADPDGHDPGNGPAVACGDNMECQAKNPPPADTAQQGVAQEQKGTLNILGRSVPYTIAAMPQDASAAALATLKSIANAINAAQDQLAPDTIKEIEAVKSVYIGTHVSSGGGYSITNPQNQEYVLQNDHIRAPIGTFVIGSANLPKATSDYWASTFAHEGTHILHKENESAFAEHRAYHEQYVAAPAFHLQQNEIDFIKQQCGAACH